MPEFIHTVLDVLILAPAVLAGVILLAAIIGAACSGANIGRYGLNLLISVDQSINTLLGGSPDETISAVAYRKGGSRYDPIRWRITYHTINTVFFWQTDHCRRAYETEKRGGHLHPSYQE